MEGDPVRLITATAVCLALLTTAACSSDPQPAAPPTPTDSVSATSAAPPEDTAPETATETASPSTDALPELPDEAKEQTEAGAEAFVEFYFATLNELAEDPHENVLTAWDAPDCDTCSVFSGTIDELASLDRRAAGPFVEVEVTRTTVVDETAGADVLLSQLGPDIVDPQGTVVEEGADAREGMLLLQLSWRNGGWALSGISSRPS
jgi:hypothetical protein